jgi:hypothetical protein
MSGTPSEATVRAAKRALVGRYLATATDISIFSAALPGPSPAENIVGLGVGEKVTLNRLTGALAVKIYVRRKYPEADIAQAERIPGEIDGVPTDIEEVGTIEALSAGCTVARRQRQRPAPCGVSVGHLAISAGTIGAVVRDSSKTDNGKRYILSNNHVLANNNSALAGDAIWQPGKFDGGTPSDQIGTLARFVPLDFAGGDNRMDAAIAEITPGVVVDDLCAIGPLAGRVTPTRNLTVLKHGRTTGLTRGVITDVDADIRVNYPGFGAALFINTVVVRGLPPTSPFSAGGDSGSLIVDAAHKACALLFAGSTAADVTFANPLATVLRRLRVRLL